MGGCRRMALKGKAAGVGWGERIKKLLKDKIVLELNFPLRSPYGRLNSLRSSFA